jgi:protein O-mannosyl-transferase
MVRWCPIGEPSSSRRASMTAILVTAVVACVAFVPTMRCGLVLDDDDIILQNPLVTNSGPWFRFWTYPYWPRGLGWDLLYRPITILSLRLNYLVHGGWPAGYHLVNVLLHGAVTAIVTAMAIRWWKRPAAGWVAGLLYAAHPAHVEAVTPAVGRSELLAAAFFAGALYLHLTTPADARLPVYRRAVVIGLLFFLALGSKEHIVFVYPVFIVLDLYRRRRIPALAGLGRRDYFNRALLPHHFFLLVALLVFSLLRWNVFRQHGLLDLQSIDPHANPLAVAGLAERLWTPFFLFALTLRIVIWPVNLTTFYDVGNTPPMTSLYDSRVLAGVVLFAVCVVATAYALWRNHRILLPLTAFLFSMLLPCQFVATIKWFFAERWLYLPTLFLALGLAGAVAYRPRAAVVASVILCVCFLPNTWSYASIWSDDLTMYLATMERRPGTFQGRYRAGLEYTLQKRYGEAAPLIDKLMKDFPTSVHVNQLGLIHYLGVDDLDRAEQAAARLAAIDPFLAPAGELAERLNELRRKHERVPASQSMPTSGTSDR